MIGQLIREKLHRVFGSLGYLVVTKWRLSEPDIQKLFDGLGYVLFPKSRLSAAKVQLLEMPSAISWFGNRTRGGWARRTQA